MSVLRSYAQRNNNVTQLVPEFVDVLPDTVLSNASLYSLNLSNVQYTGGIYFVDMSQPDSLGNLINYDGSITSSNDNSIHNVNFTINIQTPAASYPGLEFTLFFKNIPYDRLDINPLLSIGIYSPIDGPSIPYILSPPFPSLFGVNVSPSITFKSDGTNFTVSSSGPAGWLGFPALLSILTTSYTFG
jgi:hypothetical protein